VALVVVVLGAAAGASDAVTFLGGQVFASVMTGNLVLVGVSASSRNGSLALHAGLALAGYAAGALMGTWRCRPTPSPTWPPGTLTVLAVELAGLVAVAVARGVTVGTVPAALESVMVAVAAAAMGLQSAVGRAAPARPRSTTYLTGALTEVLASVTAGRGLAGDGATLAILGAAVLGAGGAAALAVFEPRVAPLLAVTLVTVALLVVMGERGRSPDAEDTSGT
jgi:uncharacterized membrane protein YoaK (UPF0700 family)